LGKQHVVATLALGLALFGCTRSNYLYVALSGANVEVAESGKPDIGAWHVGGGPIPTRYALKEAGASLTLAVGDESFVPSFEIVSSAPIRNVSVGSGYAIRKSEVEYKVFWSSVRVGQSVEIAIDLEGRVDPVVVAGVVAESGSVISYDSL
jgi:hypothetical protein